MVKRNKLEIIQNILNIIKNNGKIRVTPLLRKSNLSSSRFKEYFLELKEKTFIKETEFAGIKYIINTDKGNRFLEKYFSIISFVKEFDL